MAIDNYLKAYLEQERTILVVEDDPRYRELIKIYLEEEGYLVRETDNGEEGVHICQKEDIDLVLLDVMMPGKDGFTTCKEIKELPLTGFMPVVMLTALNDSENKLKAFQYGADDFLDKPVNRVELIIRIMSLLRIRFLSLEMENTRNILYTFINILESKDHYTKGHSERVATWSKEIAIKVQQPLIATEDIYKGGLLHDIGKVAISNQILLKNGPLDTNELRDIRRHPVIGEKICKPLKSLDYVLPIIRHHHEKLDGSGYPDGIMAEEIKESVRIVSLVDIYDALTSHRSYRKKLSKEKALEIIAGEIETGWWDEEIFYYLTKIVDNH